LCGGWAFPDHRFREIDILLELGLGLRLAEARPLSAPQAIADGSQELYPARMPGLAFPAGEACRVHAAIEQRHLAGGQVVDDRGQGLLLLASGLSLGLDPIGQHRLAGP
jgi:hypothetical protein